MGIGEISWWLAYDESMHEVLQVTPGLLVMCGLVSDLRGKEFGLAGHRVY